MTQSEAVNLPTKKELLILLGDARKWRSEEVRELRRLSEEADDKFEAFKKNNAEYLRLEKGVDDASDRFDSLRRKEQNEIFTKIKKFRERLVLRGVTPKIVDDIEDFMSQYPSDEE